MPSNNNRRFGRDRSYINMSGKVNGKNYELIDVENLKEANKQMAELIRHQQEFIDKQDARIRNQEEINEQDREYYRNNKKNIEDMTRRMEENNKVIAGWNRNIRSNLINNPNKDNILDSLINRSANNQRVPRTISDLFRNQMQESNRKSVNDIYDKAVKSVVNSYKRKGADFTDPAVMNKMNRDIQDRVLANDEFNKITKKFGTKAELFNVAVNTFNEAIRTWVGVFKAGLNRQTETYENTFENISVRNGTTRSQYYNAQMNLNNQLGAMGLRNNIGTSEVQTMWNTLASNGVKLDISNAEQTARAIETVVTKHIVPYLDTSSKSFTIINERLNGRFVKDIRGINEANREIAGNNYATQEMLQQLIDEVQPMSDKALEDLAQGSTEVTTMINSLINSGWSEDAAKSYATQLYKMQRYSDQILSSGSLTERMTLIDAGNAGLSPYDLKDFNDIMGIAVANDQMISSWTPGYNGVFSGTVTNKVGSATGVDYGRMMGAINSRKKGITANELVALSNKAGENLSNYNNTVNDRWTNDQNQTNKRLQDVTVENLANEFAFLNEWLGNWAGVIETAIKGIGAILLTKVIGGVIGKGIGALSGLGGSLSGGSGLLGGIGALFSNPIGIGIATIGAIAGTVALINSKVSNQHEEERKSNISNRQGTYQASIDEGLGEAQAISNAWNDNSAIKGNGIFENGGETELGFTSREKMINGDYYTKQQSFDTFANDTEGKIQMNFSSHAGGSMLEAFSWLDGDTREALGLKKDWTKSGYDEAKIALEKYRKEYKRREYNKIKTYALGKLLATNKSIPFNYTMAALSAAVILGGHSGDEDIVGPLNDNTYGFGGNVITDKKRLQEVLDANGITEAKYLTAIYKILGNKNADFYLMAKGQDKWVTFPSEEDLKSNFNLHRYGLSAVPYDEYPALLHQGEAVLTATTAAELRNLLEEYRQTSQQSVNFDNIIQTQTSALVSKIDEVIKTIEHNKIGTFNNTDSMHKSRELLADSMRYMKSTKSF